MLPLVSSGGALASLLSLSFSTSFSSFTVLEITCFFRFSFKKIGVQLMKVRKLFRPIQEGGGMAGSAGGWRWALASVSQRQTLLS